MTLERKHWSVRMDADVKDPEGMRTGSPATAGATSCPESRTVMHHLSESFMSHM